jgi:hypothetical protein
MVMRLVFCEHFFTKVNANPNQAQSTAQLLLRTVTEESKLNNPLSQLNRPVHGGGGGALEKGAGGDSQV